ncbi:transmembrane protein, putative (macronuclear) [Tetrahymena thermophila SB210]|uniref:Transmembrane protein, putative n=1 Tax=Tetrahymena thermophila (strain SB210) TaxID=312017 RepID=W7XBX5_TETTS|nr:transmembrane protein, putative [Tetrahymena thermophila SB210]EWS73953.1 transmembrane protein, putative [Tetrahymena thermophila SB210]|eukprot:XP_012653494.1 transmembrane protein, putative [Tetrahymena thermophila SB210]
MRRPLAILYSCHNFFVTQLQFFPTHDVLFDYPMHSFCLHNILQKKILIQLNSPSTSQPVKDFLKSFREDIYFNTQNSKLCLSTLQSEVQYMQIIIQTFPKICCCLNQIQLFSILSKDKSFLKRLNQTRKWQQYLNYHLNYILFPPFFYFQCKIFFFIQVKRFKCFFINQFMQQCDLR